MAASKHTWRIELDEVQDEIRYYTKADDVLRQTFKVAELPQHIRDKLAIRGVKVTMEERNSSVPAAAVQASMDAREDVWSVWASGSWGKQRKGGGFTVKIEIQALAAIKKTTVAKAREALQGYDEETQKRILTSDAVKAKVAELRAAEGADEVTFDDLV